MHARTLLNLKKSFVIPARKEFFSTISIVIEKEFRMLSNLGRTSTCQYDHDDCRNRHTSKQRMLRFQDIRYHVMSAYRGGIFGVFVSRDVSFHRQAHVHSKIDFFSF